MGFRSAVRLRSLLSLLVLGWALMLVFSCKPVKLGSGEGSPTTPPLPPRRETIWKDFDSHRSIEAAQTILSYGNRIASSEALDKVRTYLKKELAASGWEVTEQPFSEQAAGGQQINFSSLIGHYAKVKPVKPFYLVAAHFDSPNLGITVDPGATDGAANTAILLEVAHTLSLDPRLAAHVEILFLDGHMPFHQISPNDGLFGSRFHAQMLQINRNADTISAAVVLEHLGGYGSTLSFAKNSDPAVIERFRAAAQALKIELEAGKRPLLLDHVPFENAGVPAIALLDANAIYLNTADDDASRLSPDALAEAGQLVLYFLSENSNPPAPSPTETALSEQALQRTRGKN
jgi:Zn-dependent M28 family amino/carboxypeptidase